MTRESELVLSPVRACPLAGRATALSSLLAHRWPTSPHVGQLATWEGHVTGVSAAGSYLTAILLCVSLLDANIMRKHKLAGWNSSVARRCSMLQFCSENREKTEHVTAYRVTRLSVIRPFSKRTRGVPVAAAIRRARFAARRRAASTPMMSGSRALCFDFIRSRLPQSAVALRLSCHTRPMHRQGVCTGR